MRIAAMLSYYDEQPAWLERLAASLELVDHVTHLVAVSGQYVGHDHEPEHDPAESHAALTAGARAAGIILDHRQQQRWWPTQIGKRNAALITAEAYRPDWLLVIDGDEHVTSCDPDLLARQLAEHPTLHVAESLTIHTGTRYLNDGGAIRRLYRAGQGIRIERAHMGYRTADGQWLHGDPAYVRVQPAIDCTRALTVTGDYRQRSPLREQADDRYRMRRREQGHESWGA